MEVAQIARTVARALSLNEDLTEAIALAHDIGHGPFGHTGEDALAELMKEHGGFEHNRQALRIVEVIERKYPLFPGLNLTEEVRESLLKHGGSRSASRRRPSTRATASPTTRTTWTTASRRGSSTRRRSWTSRSGATRMTR